MHKLFGEFQKISAKPTAGEASFGLGLAIVKRLLLLMGDPSAQVTGILEALPLQ